MRRHVDQVAALELSVVDLLCHLDGIAPVSEHGGALFENDRLTSRSGKAGQPGQALFARRQVFAAMLIRTWQYEAVNAKPRDLGTRLR